MNVNFIQTGGNTIYAFFQEVGYIFIFLGKTLKQYTNGPFEWGEFFNQCYTIGYKTLLIIAITAFILGAVLSLQLLPVLIDFGAGAWLPGIISMSIVKEIGPVITGLICAGKVASGMGAELGSMRVTEQIEAMEVSATNPMKFLVSTRVLAATLMLPVLVIYADAIALLGSYVAMNMNQDIYFLLYFYDVFEALSFSDFFHAIIKTLFFGLAIGLIGSYKGYYAKRGTAGVGIAANSAVVMASMAIFIIDLLAVQISHIFKGL